MDSPRVRQEVTAFNPPSEGVGSNVRRAARQSSTEAFHLAIVVAALMCFVGAGVNAAEIRNRELRTEVPESAVPADATG